MKKTIMKMLGRPKAAISAAAAIAVIASGIAYNNIGVHPRYQFAEAKRETITEETAVTGTVKAAQEIDLAFPKSGRINTVSVAVGETVRTGETLAALDAQDAQGVVQQATGALALAQAAYQKMLNGTTDAELDVDKTAVAAANVNVQSTKTNLELIKAKEAVDVGNAYRALLNSTPEAVPFSGVNDFYAPPTVNGTYALDKEGAITVTTSYTNVPSFSYSGLASGSAPITTLNAQPLGNTGLFIKFPTTYGISGLSWTITLPNVKAGNYVANQNAYQAALQTQSDAVSAAQSAFDAAEASLAQVQASLNAKQISARPEDIAAAEAQVESAKGALQAAQGAYANDFIVSPIAGIVTAVDAKPGEIASANKSAIRLISQGKFQIETFVSQGDLGKTPVGAKASVALDAYGPGTPFNATVIAVDPASTMQNGQASYKVTLEFSDADPKIKPGLSADATIFGAAKENALAVPRASVVIRNGEPYVLVESGSGTEERKIVTGLEGRDAIEIVSGISPGERVAAFGN